jgi:hypothetical protein
MGGRVTMKIYELESVGTIIDDNGVTYPMLANGQPDWDQGMELTRVEAGEWWDHLSDYDKATVLDVWFAAKKVWWDRSSEITSEAQGCSCTGRICAPCWMNKSPGEVVIERLKGRESDIPLLPPPALVEMFRFGG